MSIPLSVSAQSTQPHNQAAESTLAESFIRCETFYKHYYESIKISNPAVLKIPSIARLPAIARVARLSAEALVGENEAKAIFGKNIEAQVVEFTKASIENWPDYANKMSSECIKLFKDNDTETFNERVKSYAEQRGLSDILELQ